MVEPCKGGGAMIKNPIVIHIAAMLEALDDMPLRAVYMVVRQLYLLQQASRDETLPQE